MNDKIEKAYAEIFALCKGKKWQMSVPVNEDKDSDCVIIDGIKSAEEEADKEHAKLTEMKEKVKQWVDDERDFDMVSWFQENLDKLLSIVSD